MLLPEQGLPGRALRDLIEDARSDDAPWREGRSWSLVYEPPTAYRDEVRNVAAEFVNENALSHHAFPSVAYFESRVISMVASVVGGGGDTHGVFCAGGTESLLLAMKAYRDRRDARGNEVLVPRTAHPGFAKAAQLLGLRVRVVEVATDGRLDVNELLGAITDETCVIGLSAPNFPYGAVDPVADIASAAHSRGVGVHVDAALGGLVLPFLDAPPRFGLDVPGVTSLSVDVHKYGYAPKGASVLLFGDEGLRHASYFVWTDWLGGAFASGSILGTRPVSSAAGAFAALATIGHDGYRKTVHEVMAIAQRLRDGLTQRGWSIIGEPSMSVFAATPPDAERLGGIVAGMSERGWRLDALHQPPALHFVVTPRHGDVIDAFLDDLDESTEKADSQPDGDMASYGVVLRGAAPTTDALLAHLDERYDGAK